MIITIQYTYSQALQRMLFVEYARTATQASIKLEPAGLGPVARLALLDARVPFRSYSGAQSEVDAHTEELRHCANIHQLDLIVPEPVDEEPNPAQAALDAERLLLDLVAATPALEAAWAIERARREQDAAAKADAEASKHAAAVASIRSAGIDAVLRRREGQWESTYPSDSVPRNSFCREALGEDVATLAKTEADRRNEIENTERTTTETAWITEHAPDLLDRYREGFLPEAELLDRVRDAIFGAIVAPRYSRIVDHEILFTENCDPDAEYSVGDADELTAAEYAALQVIREQAGGGATVQAREHEGHCGCRHCGSVDNTQVTRRSARVSVGWGGRTLSREYGLG